MIVFYMKKYILFGIGNEVRLKYSNAFVKKIHCIVDNDEKKWGKSYCGKIIQKPSAELLRKDSFVIVSNILEYDEIRKQLVSYGMEENVDFVWGPYWFGDEELPSAYDAKDWCEYDDVIDFSFGKWDYRVQKVASLIPEDAASVMDLGAGAMSLKNYIKDNVRYTPVDYMKRCDNTFKCDFEKKEFPNIYADCIACSGIIEYMTDVKWFVARMCEMCKTVVVSYIPVENMGDYRIRQQEGWKNHMNIVELCTLFFENGFIPIKERQCAGNDLIIRFDKR